MTVQMSNLGFRPKGRQHIRRNSSTRTVGLWALNAEPNTTLAKLEKAYLGALAAVDAIEDHKVAAKATGRFTDQGLVDGALQFAVSELAPTLHRDKQTIAAAKTEATERRAKLRLEPADKTDAVGFARRAEIRGWLRSLPANERNAFVGQISKLDPEIALAIVEVRPELSGVLAADRDQLLDRALLAQHGPAIQEVEELERGIELADRAISMAREELATEAGIDLTKFNEAAAPYEKAATAPWLRKRIEGGVEVIRCVKLRDAGGGGVEVLATPEEIEMGQYFANYDEYRQAGGTGGGGGLSGAA